MPFTVNSRTRMRQAVALAATTILVTTVLTGCGSTASPGATTSLSPSEATPTIPQVDASLDSVTGDPAALVARVDGDRIMTDVRTLGKTPRDPAQNRDQTIAAAEYVKTQLQDAGLAPKTIDVTLRDITLPTVWAEIHGQQCADRVFVLTAHYDTVPGSPGADDDASGVAGVLETARILADAQLPATVVVAAVPFEEEGSPYAGAAALATELIEQQHRDVFGMVSAEMLGYATTEPNADGQVGDFLNVLGYPDAEQLVQIFDHANTEWAGGAKAQVATVPETETFISRSDHAAFHLKRVPAAFATDGANFRTPYYHTPQDVPENISTDFFAGAVRTLVAGTIGMAGRTAACEG
ncbi:M20/M25/M40 family metallo-hydrolase [uncultured Microbacterium sp.]|uniref:M28 family metallopeptidase n=1 Tax=uncultured Microbacterium sp. TaxID=191216 RepID=UPI002627F4C4|nr:M20/M25/M40 family metallo-hydrolase [uncultured Microbacterium sp.]